MAYIQGKSNYPVQVTVTSDIWRTQTRLLPVPERHFALEKCPIDSLCMEYPDVVKDVDEDLVVYHRNDILFIHLHSNIKVCLMVIIARIRLLTGQWDTGFPEKGSVSWLQLCSQQEKELLVSA